MPKKNPIGRSIIAAKDWVLRVSHQVTSSGSMDARQPGSERRIRTQPWEPERRNNDRREIT